MIAGDYLTLMLVNLSAGLFLLAAYFNWGATSPNPRMWCPGFAMVGLVAMICGFHMTLTWPMGPKAGWAHVAFGEMYVLFGIAYLGAALALGRHWPLHSVAIYTLVAGAVAIVMGVYIALLPLSKAPELTAAGFILAGLAGALALPVVGNSGNKVLRRFAALVSLAGAGLWMFVAMMSYWAHLAPFANK